MKKNMMLQGTRNGFSLSIGENDDGTYFLWVAHPMMENDIEETQGNYCNCLGRILSITDNDKHY